MTFFVLHGLRREIWHVVVVDDIREMDFPGFLEPGIPGEAIGVCRKSGIWTFRVSRCPEVRESTPAVRRVRADVALMPREDRTRCSGTLMAAILQTAVLRPSGMLGNATGGGEMRRVVGGRPRRWTTLNVAALSRVTHPHHVR